MAKSQEKPPTEGCRLLRLANASGLSLAEIGRIAGASKPAVTKWLRGGKPDDTRRARLAADPRTQIPRDAWDRASGTLAAAPRPAPSPAAPSPAPRPAPSPPEPPVPQVDAPPPVPWADAPELTPPPLPPPAPEPPPPAPYEPHEVDLEASGAARALVVAQIRRLQADTARLREIRASDDVIRKAEDAERKAILDLAKLAGELNPTEEARLVKSVKWHAIKAATFKALEPWPEAVQAVADAFAREGA